MSIPAGMRKGLYGQRRAVGDKNPVVTSQLTSYLVVKINEVSQQFQWGSFCHICQLPPLVYDTPLPVVHMKSCVQ